MEDVRERFGLFIFLSSISRFGLKWPAAGKREMLDINTLKTASWPRSTHINIYVVGCQQETHQIIGSSEWNINDSHLIRKTIAQLLPHIKLNTNAQH